MRKEIDPQNTSRADAFSLWSSSPMPMVTLVKTLDVTRLVKASRRAQMPFNMMMCWCIGKAASHILEFFDIPADDRMYRFSRLAVGPVVVNCKGGINYCDIPFSDDLLQFARDYDEICAKAAARCENLCLDSEMMVIGTSAMVQTELDCIVNQYAKGFNNPMVMWGKYRKGLFRTTLPVSFQFHHVQMDGGHGATFLDNLQTAINALR
ncbi:MAG: CatA-like O-acetyltransferase, family 2 [Candidatus Cryptobacteroides sp.]